MCGILAIIGQTLPPDIFSLYLRQLKNRGPEGQRFLTADSIQLGFTRLAINGVDDGMQPMTHDNLTWICNGEIYNFARLAERYGIKLTTGSDCEVIGPLLKRMGLKQFFRALDGVFAMVISDGDVAIIARDPYGVRPLYVGNTSQYIAVASELKALPHCEYYKPFPPGHYAMVDLKTLVLNIVPYHTIPFLKNPEFNNLGPALDGLRYALTSSVTKRLITERPIAALLSGGLDSSLIAALVQRELKLLGLPKLKTFSIGFKGSEDLRCAKLVANHIGSDHTEVVMTPQEFWDAIPEVIHDIESYDITTVRASVGNWLVAREISRRTDCKVVFNGDGSDEVLGGYLYFHKSPSEEEFESEIERLLTHIHYFDVLRSDRCISRHGLEPRTPFLDKQFVNVARSIPTHLLRPVGIPEKWILRCAFKYDDILPSEVLWRKKEAFSDGVSGITPWFEFCKAKAELIVGKWDRNMYSHLPPQTAEAFYYRTLFENLYPGMADMLPYHWMPAWSPETTDPSARTLNPTTPNTS